MYNEFVDFVRGIYQNKSGFIPLHAPVFLGNEKKYLLDTIDYTFVSSVGQYVDKFEEMLVSLTGAKYAVATVNGTLALHLGLLLLGVSKNDKVLTQSLTFVATANAIRYMNAEPLFIDVDKDTMGLSPKDTAGAGDSFLVASSMASAVGADIWQSAYIGSLAAACQVGRVGNIPLKYDEIVKEIDL